MLSNSSLRKVLLSDLPLILDWRNHPEIRRYMFTQHEISLEEHIQWFEQSDKDPLRHLWIYEENDISLGFVSFYEQAKSKVADWGFYVSPEAPKGTGRKLGQVALNHAFCEWGFHKICGQALAFNERSIKFHLSLGFSQEGRMREQHFDGESYHDVLHFGILANELNS